MCQLPRVNVAQTDGELKGHEPDCDRRDSLLLSPELMALMASSHGPDRTTELPPSLRPHKHTAQISAPAPPLIKQLPNSHTHFKRLNSVWPYRCLRLLKVIYPSFSSSQRTLHVLQLLHVLAKNIKSVTSVILIISWDCV